MLVFLSFLLFAVFVVLAGLHFTWVLGGTWGLEESLPTKEDGVKIINPRKIDSFVVGLGLTGFGLFYLFRSGMVPLALPSWIFQYGGWIIPAIFILRAIGEFKYVGLFKKIRNTPFGQLDTKFFSPLCLTVGVLGMIIQTMN